MNEYEYAVKYYESVLQRKTKNERDHLYFTYKNFLRSKLKEGKPINKNILRDMLEVRVRDLKLRGRNYDATL